MGLIFDVLEEEMSGLEVTKTAGIVSCESFALVVQVNCFLSFGMTFSGGLFFSLLSCLLFLFDLIFFFFIWEVKTLFISKEFFDSISSFKLFFKDSLGVSSRKCSCRILETAELTAAVSFSDENGLFSFLSDLFLAKQNLQMWENLFLSSKYIILSVSLLRRHLV